MPSPMQAPVAVQPDEQPDVQTAGGSQQQAYSMSRREMVNPKTIREAKFLAGGKKNQSCMDAMKAYVNDDEFLFQ